MILVDTTVVIDLLKGIENKKIKLFEEVLSRNVPYGISSYTFQEVLQGVKDEGEYGTVRRYLLSQKIYFLPENIETYEKAALMFFRLRRQGITIRSTIDILIALTAIEHNLLLLHNDRDFDYMAASLPELKVFNLFYA